GVAGRTPDRRLAAAQSPALVEVLAKTMRAVPVICHLMHGLRVGGAEVLVARLARRLRDRFAFRFLCLDELGSLGEELQREGFPVEVVRRRPGVDWRLALRLSSVLSRGRVDLVHAHQY